MISLIRDSIDPGRKLILTCLSQFGAFALTVSLIGCGSSDNGTPSGTAGGDLSIGGAKGVGGNYVSGGVSATGGAAPAIGGSAATSSSRATGGRSLSTGGSEATSSSNATGGRSLSTDGHKASGAPGTGGTVSGTIVSTGGSSTGATATGGRMSTGGVNNGGMQAGGAKPTGGKSATDGTTGGNAATGGSTASGGGSACAFPTSFKWKDSGGPLAQPQSSSVKSLKDFSVAWDPEKSVYVVYATAFTTNWTGVVMTFSDFAQMGSAKQTLWRGAVAPTIFYFTLKKTWVLTYQWGFQYATSNDPTNSSSWSSGKSLLSGDPTGGSGPIDQTVICDSTNCYLFFAGDNGHIYRASMPIGSFPGTFSNASSIISETSATVFEAVQVYAVKGTGKYLMIIETNTSPRYFRAYSANSLDGSFTAIAGASSQSTPFAGKSNVTFTGTPWTADISHGDLVRDNPDETQTVDACNMRLLYQGRDPSSGGDYGQLPYRPGLLTKTN